MESEDEADENAEVMAVIINANTLLLAKVQMMAMELMEESSEKEEEESLKQDHRKLPRPGRRKLDHATATALIHQDYLGAQPRYTDFADIYRISRTRFERMLQDFANSGNPFYRPKYGASLEARLLLPLKCLCYSVSPKSFGDYFSMSETFAGHSCKVFDNISGSICVVRPQRI